MSLYIHENTFVLQKNAARYHIYIYIYMKKLSENVVNPIIIIIIIKNVLTVKCKWSQGCDLEPSSNSE